MQRVKRVPVTSGKNIEESQIILMEKVAKYVNLNVKKNSNLDNEEKNFHALAYLVERSIHINKSVWTGVFLELFKDHDMTYEFRVAKLIEENEMAFWFSENTRIQFKPNGEILFTNMEREDYDKVEAFENIPFVEDVPLLFDDEVKYPLHFIFGDAPVDDFRFWTVWGMKPLFEALTGDHETFAYRNALNILSRILTDPQALTDEDEYEIPVTEKDFKHGARLEACGGDVILIKDSPKDEMALEVIFVPASGKPDFLSNVYTYVTA